MIFYSSVKHTACHCIFAIKKRKKWMFISQKHQQKYTFQWWRSSVTRCRTWTIRSPTSATCSSSRQKFASNSTFTVNFIRNQFALASTSWTSWFRLKLAVLTHFCKRLSNQIVLYFLKGIIFHKMFFLIGIVLRMFLNTSVEQTIK